MGHPVSRHNPPVTYYYICILYIINIYTVLFVGVDIISVMLMDNKISIFDMLYNYMQSCSIAC